MDIKFSYLVGFGSEGVGDYDDDDKEKVYI